MRFTFGIRGGVRLGFILAFGGLSRGFILRRIRIVGFRLGRQQLANKRGFGQMHKVADAVLAGQGKALFVLAAHRAGKLRYDNLTGHYLSGHAQRHNTVIVDCDRHVKVHMGNRSLHMYDHISKKRVASQQKAVLKELAHRAVKHIAADPVSVCLRGNAARQAAIVLYNDVLADRDLIFGKHAVQHGRIVHVKQHLADFLILHDKAALDELGYKSLKLRIGYRLLSKRAQRQHGRQGQNSAQHPGHPFFHPHGLSSSMFCHGRRYARPCAARGHIPAGFHYEQTSLRGGLFRRKFFHSFLSR